MECYGEKVGTETQRQYRVFYTRVRTTTTWARKVHCRACGYKGEPQSAIASSLAATMSDSSAMVLGANGTHRKEGDAVYQKVQNHEIDDESPFVPNGEDEGAHQSMCEEEGMELTATDKGDSSLNIV